MPFQLKVDQLYVFNWNFHIPKFFLILDDSIAILVSNWYDRLGVIQKYRFIKDSQGILKDCMLLWLFFWICWMQIASFGSDIGDIHLNFDWCINNFVEIHLVCETTVVNCKRPSRYRKQSVYFGKTYIYIHVASNRTWSLWCSILFHIYSIWSDWFTIKFYWNHKSDKELT